MGKMLRVSMLLLLLAGISLPAFAQEQAAIDAKQQVSGVIVSFDAVAGTMIVEKAKDATTGVSEKCTIVLSKDVVISKSEGALKADELKVGDMVAVFVKTVDGVLTAESILLESK